MFGVRIKLHNDWVYNAIEKNLNTFPLGRPSSFKAWKIPFSVLPEPNVLVMLQGEKNRTGSTMRSQTQTCFISSAAI